MNPLVSVVCICRNHERFCVESLDSVLNQTYKNIEWIVLDAASTDSTVELIDSWLIKNNVNAIFLKEQELRSVTVNLNKALKFANGDYIQFLSLDDVLIPDKLNVQVKLLTDNSDCVFVYSDVVVIDKNSNIIQNSWLENKKLPYTPTGFIFQELMKYGYFINAPSLLWCSRKMKAIGNFDEQFSFEDMEYVYRSCLKWPVIFSDKLSVRYRFVENSLSHNTFGLFDIDVIKVQLKYLPHNQNKLISRVDFEIYKGLIRLYKNNTDKPSHLGLFFRFFILKPDTKSFTLFLCYMLGFGYYGYKSIARKLNVEMKYDRK